MGLTCWRALQLSALLPRHRAQRTTCRASHCAYLASLLHAECCGQHVKYSVGLGAEWRHLNHLQNATQWHTQTHTDTHRRWRTGDKRTTTSSYSRYGQVQRQHGCAQELMLPDCTPSYMVGRRPDCLRKLTRAMRASLRTGSVCLCRALTSGICDSFCSQRHSTNTR